MKESPNAFDQVWVIFDFDETYTKKHTYKKEDEGGSGDWPENEKQPILRDGDLVRENIRQGAPEYIQQHLNLGHKVVIATRNEYPNLIRHYLSAGGLSEEEINLIDISTDKTALLNEIPEILRSNESVKIIQFDDEERFLHVIKLSSLITNKREKVELEWVHVTKDFSFQEYSNTHSIEVSTHNAHYPMLKNKHNSFISGKIDFVESLRSEKSSILEAFNPENEGYPTHIQILIESWKSEFSQIYDLAEGLVENNEKTLPEITEAKETDIAALIRRIEAETHSVEPSAGAVAVDVLISLLTGGIGFVVMLIIAAVNTGGRENQELFRHHFGISGAEIKRTKEALESLKRGIREKVENQGISMETSN